MTYSVAKPKYVLAIKQDINYKVDLNCLKKTDEFGHGSSSSCSLKFTANVDISYPPTSTTKKIKPHRAHHCPLCHRTAGPRCRKRGHFGLCDLHPECGPQAIGPYSKAGGCLKCINFKKFSEKRAA